MNRQYITIDRDGPVATIALRDAAHKNALGFDMQIELIDALQELGDDRAAKCIVLTGSGSTFSSGGNIAEMRARYEAGSASAFGLGTATRYHRLVWEILHLRQPLVAAVNGDAIGLGATLALLCDIGVIAETARFGDPHVHLGLSSGDGAVAIWPLLIGHAAARELILRGQMIRGDAAHKLGFFRHSKPADDVVVHANSIAHEIAQLPVDAVQMSKRALNKAIWCQYEAIGDVALAWEMLTMGTKAHGDALARSRKGTR